MATFHFEPRAFSGAPGAWLLSTSVAIFALAIWIVVIYDLVQRWPITAYFYGLVVYGIAATAGTVWLDLDIEN
jgi:hypothetical protein